MRNSMHSKGQGSEKLEIVFKDRKMYYGKSEKFLDNRELEIYKKTIQDTIGFSPEWNVDNKPTFHDRKVVIDGMVYLLGHSFNIPKGTFTYSIGLDKITYYNGMKLKL